MKGRRPFSGRHPCLRVSPKKNCKRWPCERRGNNFNEANCCSAKGIHVQGSFSLFPEKSGYLSYHRLDASRCWRSRVREVRLPSPFLMVEITLLPRRLPKTPKYY